MRATGDKQADSYLSITPTLAAATRTESRDIGLNLAVGGNWFLDRPEYNATDYLANLASNWRAELDQWRLSAGSKRDSTLQSELDATGTVMTRRQRTLDSLQGTWVHAFSDLWSANAGYGASRASYESGPGLVDYDDQVATAALQSTLSDSASLSLGLSSREFRTRDDRLKTQVDGISLGGNWQYSERLGLGLSIGRQWTKSDQKYDAGCIVVIAGVLGNCYPAGTTHSESSGATYSGNAGYQFEQGSLAFNASRGMVASGTGSLLRTDAIGLGYSHQLDQFLSLNLGANNTRSRNVDVDGNDSRYTSLSSSISWQLDERLAFGLGYSHSRQRSGGGDPVKNNTVFLNLNWKLAPISRGW
ncbi:MAG: outer membrane beta-barrel protein [Rhodocyclales bacterium]|nr:outer membrane beta-barrel protein [Rhodocyclales bacterium]